MKIQGPVLEGKNGRILATWFEADAEPSKPAPAVLLCHGFPGYDQFHDLAMDLQRRGIHVLAFHYSGSWGSDGDYSLSNGLADTGTALDTLLSSENPLIDRRRIFIVGHSLGGFFAAHTFAKRKEIKAAVLISPADMANMLKAMNQNPEALATFRKEMDYYCRPLNGVDAEKLISEINSHMDSYLFSTAAEGFGSRPVLIVRGSRDTVTPSKLCAEALKKSLDQIPGTNARLVSFDAQHDYLNVRQELAETVYGFLKTV